MVDVRLIHPFTCCVAGPTSCGKSVLVQKIIEKGTDISDTDFTDILWCYLQWHPNLSHINKKVIFQQGLENLERCDYTEPRLIVIDDLLSECNAAVVDLFTRGSHHTNVSVIFITQNLFHQGKNLRTITLNSHYIIVFKNPRDAAQIAYFGRQLYPLNSKFVPQAYKDATSTPHSYLLFDLKQATPDDCRCRSNILGENPPGYPIVYQPIDKKKK